MPAKSAKRKSVARRRSSVPPAQAEGDNAAPEKSEEKEVVEVDVKAYPLDQLELTEEELKKEVTLVLSSDDPYVTDEAVEFSFKERQFVPLASTQDSISFFSQAGTMVHKSLFHSVKGESKEAESEKDVFKRRNKFNFCDRGTQTLNHGLRSQYAQTHPVVEIKLGFNAALMEITEACELLKLNDSNKVVEAPKESDSSSIKKERDIKRCATVLERMLNQNKFTDVILDFRYYDNPCDEFMSLGLGSLLPLWKFSFREMKGFTVTSLSWNHQYPDMFAAAFGLVDFMCDLKGCICIYSLKDSSSPERAYFSDSSVHSIVFNKKWPYLLAAGFRDGRVAVYDLRHDVNSSLVTSECGIIEHNDVVHQVVWLDDDIYEQHNFCSVSGGGKVVNWCLAQNHLVAYELMYLKNKECATAGPENCKLDAISPGTCISFQNDSTDVYLVGTEEGLIHKCSGLYANKYLNTYRGHSNTVYNVEWNPFHSKVFLSCSADWTIRVWDCEEPESIFIFDLYNEVQAIAWAPFSSTLFAGVTRDGKVHVFDLMWNRQQPTCSYSLHGPKKHIIPSSVAFNPKLPILIVGDARGYITSLKLSPNLRASLPALTELERSKYVECEISKMEKVLKSAKNPDSVPKSTLKK